MSSQGRSYSSSDPPSSPVEFSGVSTQSSQCAGTSQESDDHVVNEPTGKKGRFPCPICQKILKTVNGFTSHQILHKINNANVRKPSFEDLEVELLCSCNEILEEIIQEPSVNEECLKKKLLAETTLNFLHAENFCYFLNSVATPIIEIMVVRSKISPSNQLNENVKQFNSLRNSDSYMSDLQLCFNLLLSETDVDVSPFIRTRFIYRFSQKVFYKLQSIVFKKMREFNEPVAAAPSTMINEEESAFFSVVGCILRSQFKKNKESLNPISRKFCVCLRNKFVSTKINNLTVKQFLNAFLWKDVEKSVAQVSISDVARKLFVGIENIIRMFGVSSSDSVFNALMEPQNEDLVDMWSLLTCSYLTEADSLKYLKDLVSALVNFSSAAEASKQHKLWVSKNRPQKFALRAGLKKN